MMTEQHSYHISITATTHVFADVTVVASDEQEALALARLEASAGCIKWSEGDLDVDEVWIEDDPLFHPSQTIRQEENAP